MISILLPIYNGEEFLHEAVNSIIKQTYKNWKLLIGVNGHGLGSDTYKRIKGKFENNKIKVYEFDFKSKPLTLNAMVKLVDTKYIALIDADDYWHKDKLKTQMPYLSKYDVVGTMGKYVGNKGGIIPIEYGEISYVQLFLYNCLINSSIIMKTEDVDYDDLCLDDYNMWFKLMIKKRRFFNLPNVLIYHRIYGNSFFNGTNNAHVNVLKEKWITYFDKHSILPNIIGVTVIMPLYKEKYESAHIKESLDSVFLQNITTREILIIINKDDIVEQLRELIKNNYRDEQKKQINIKKLKQINKNINNQKRRLQFTKINKRQMLTKSFHLGKYDLVAYIEPRDIWQKNMTQYQVHQINMYNYDAICVGGKFYGRKNGFQNNIILPSRDRDSLKFVRSAVYIENQDITHSQI